MWGYFKVPYIDNICNRSFFCLKMLVPKNENVENDTPFRVYLLNFVYFLIENIGFYDSFVLKYIFMFQKHIGWWHLNKMYN